MPRQTQQVTHIFVKRSMRTHVVLLFDDGDRRRVIEEPSDILLRRVAEAVNDAVCHREARMVPWLNGHHVGWAAHLIESEA